MEWIIFIIRINIQDNGAVIREGRKFSANKSNRMMMVCNMHFWPWAWPGVVHTHTHTACVFLEVVAHIQQITLHTSSMRWLPMTKIATIIELHIHKVTKIWWIITHTYWIFYNINNIQLLYNNTTTTTTTNTLCY